MPNRFKRWFPNLVPCFSKGQHEFPPGVSSEDIGSSEKELCIIFPESLRRFIMLTNGGKLFNGWIEFFTIENFVSKNRVARGNWFGSNDLFFAESNVYDCGSDYSFMKLGTDKEPPVMAFSADPSFVCEAALNFSNWLGLLCKQGGRAIPNDRL